MVDLDGDGVADSAAGALRIQLQAAVQAAQSVIRMRAAQAEAQQRRDLERARELRAQLNGEHAVARAEFAPVSQASWWDQAQPQDIARAYERAVAWSEADPEARAAEDRIRNEVRDRYQVDVQETAADPVALRSALEHAEEYRERAREERVKADRDRDEALALTAEADALEVGAENIERAEARMLAAEVDLVRAESEQSWDSSERRDTHAASLERAGKAKEAKAWLQADLDQARHPREAIAGAKRSPRARAGVGAAPTRQVERDGR